MQTPLPITRELLLIGGGHSHALVLRMWGMKPLAGVRVTVINPQPTAPYSGMLPGFVAGHYARGDLDIDLVQLARFAGARLIAGRAVHIDPARREVTLEGGRVLSYHVASLDIGITSDMPAMPGFTDHAVPAKPLDRFAATWDGFRARALAGDGPARAVVIGAGVAGIELALAMAHALRAAGRTAGGTAGGPAASTAEVTLIDKAEILPGMAASRRAFFRRALADAGVRLVENDAPVRIAADHVALASGARVDADLVTGAAGARAQGWLAGSGLALHEGFVVVDETLRTPSHPELFAVGDCAHLSHAPRPKAGVFAVREAPVLFHNLRAALSGGKARAFRPQKDYLKLISLGQKSALADKWGVMWHGAALWRLKDRIDRKFMEQFRGLEPMAPPAPRGPVADGVREVLGAAPLCGGCGAKVGGGALATALSGLTPPERGDILSGAGDDAAVLAGPDGRRQVISTDHLRAFTEDPALMAEIAAVHALGDIWAMGGDPQAALATITLPRLSGELQGRWLAEITGAAAAMFAREGAAIVGGHSAQGSELSVGFTVTGLCDAAPIGKGGALPGDWLVLTKPIGTGVILAGEMRLQAPGGAVMAALASMRRPHGAAARILRGCARAMTDVTGFGLAGHLAEMARASGCRMVVDLASVPVLAGAEDLARAGVRSSLWPDNRALLAGLETPDDPRADLLFDPQTAGGLLAAVPAERAEAVLGELQAAGVDARLIGLAAEAGGHSGGDGGDGDGGDGAGGLPVVQIV